jgi:ketol-acid reductoisomerase
MVTIYEEKDIDRSLVQSLQIAVIGYGNQGHAHALNLKDNGCNVVVALHAESKSRTRAEEAGFAVLSVAEATKRADVLVFCTPDVPMRAIFEEHVAPNLRPAQILVFAHGFNIHYGLIQPPANVDVAMVAPNGAGHRLRAEFLAGRGLPSLVAVHQSSTGNALKLALSYAWGIGCAKGGVIESTFKEETETDLFGEQVVLCGGLSALIKSAFDTLVEAGYHEEVAYLVCLHEVKLTVDLVYQGGLSYMRQAISDTAEWGDYLAGPKIIGEESRKGMRSLLREIQHGDFARDWIAEVEAGSPRLKAFRQAEKGLAIEKVGGEMRRRMPFIEPKEAI